MGFFPVIPRVPSGEVLYTAAGDHSFATPRRVRSVSVVVVGAGDVDGGAELSAAGNSHFNEEVVGFGSVGLVGGGFVGDGGGDGGAGAPGVIGSTQAGGGGGGAGGYFGNGGGGGLAIANDFGELARPGGGGGGVGLFGRGVSGDGGVNASLRTSNGFPGQGGGGGGGAGGANFNASRDGGGQGQGGSGGTPTNPSVSQDPGLYGGGPASTLDGRGGGGLGWANRLRVQPNATYPVKVGGNGAVRIVWPGNRRAFPNRKVGPT
jgi:hypothetical protein